MHVIDIRSSDGQLVVLGGSLVLPTSDYSVISPIEGSLRWNQDLQIVECYYSGSWTVVGPHTYPYDVYGTFIGNPTDSQLIWRIVLARTVTFPQHLPNSTAICLQAPSSNISLVISKNGSSIGSINFASSSTIGTFTFPSQIVFNSGDYLEITGPSPVNLSFSTQSWAFVGYR